MQHTNLQVSTQKDHKNCQTRKAKAAALNLITSDDFSLEYRWSKAQLDQQAARLRTQLALEHHRQEAVRRLLLDCPKKPAKKADLK